jgi:hypothetical protein
MEILLVTSYFLIFVYCIVKWSYFKIPGIAATGLIAVFALKVMLGFFMAFIYTNYYKQRISADIFKYFDDSAVLFHVFKTQPKHFFQMLFGIDADASYLKPYYSQMNFWNNRFNLYNDNRTMIKFNALLRFISFGYYGVHTVFICFLSMIGLTGFFKVFNAVLKDKFRWLFIGVYLLPSVLFWLSGVLKDGLLIFILGLVFYYFHKICTEKFSFKNILIFGVSLFMLTLIKLYILLLLLPGLVAYGWSYYSNLKWVGTRFAVIFLLAFIALFNMEKIWPEYNFKENMALKQHNFLAISKVETIGSFIAIKPINASTASIVSAAPAAFMTILTRPFLWEARTPFILLAALENVFIVLILIFVCCSFKPKKINEPLFYFSLYFSVLLFILVGLVTPIMGAFVRYKVPALPFLIVVFLFLYDKETLLRRFAFLKKYAEYL